MLALSFLHMNNALKAQIQNRYKIITIFLFLKKGTIYLIKLSAGLTRTQIWPLGHNWFSMLVGRHEFNVPLAPHKRAPHELLSYVVRAYQTMA
jgi:hypothetical protein